MRILRFLSLLSIFLLSTSCLFESFKNEITVYPILETKEYGSIPLNRTVYKVFPETQIVIYWSPGVEEAPQRLKKCVVRNRQNWQCEYPDGSGMLTMSDGNFKESAFVGNAKYVSWWKWYMIQIKAIIK